MYLQAIARSRVLQPSLMVAIGKVVRSVFVKSWVERRQAERRAGGIWSGFDLRNPQGSPRRSETAIRTRFGVVHVCGLCGSPDVPKEGIATLRSGSRSKIVSACARDMGRTHNVLDFEYDALPATHVEAWKAELAERDLL